MKKIIIFGYLILIQAGYLVAQNSKFFTSGQVVYQKQVNMYARIKRSITPENELYMNDVFEKYKKDNPQFKNFKSDLYFSENKSLFVPEPSETIAGFFSDLPMIPQINQVYTDLLSNTQVTQKKVYDQNFLVKDSTRIINWKITDEVRDIAGYVCRRANAIILDSIYVVAFYAQEIHVPSGPESFSGLPGLILQVTLPHENITWVTTKVLGMNIEPAGLVPPVKGSPIDRKELFTLLNNSSNDWGGRKNLAIMSFLL